jgi:hypothetical protein
MLVTFIEHFHSFCTISEAIKDKAASKQSSKKTLLLVFKACKASKGL